MSRKAATFLLLASLATPAMAQELTAMVATYGPFGLNDLDGDLPTSAELRVTVPISKTLAVEPFGTAGRAARA